jgi:PAS domain S-box-containing protein
VPVIERKASLHKATSSESVDLYRLLVDRVQDYAIFALDPSGCVLSWNTGAQRLKGYSAAEIIGKHFSVFYPPETAGFRPAEELEEAIATGKAEDMGWRVRKDGSRFWANVLITALRDDNGTLVGFAKVTRDLTERQAAEDELRQSEERFRLLIESVRDYAIFMLDPQGFVRTWNSGAERLKGYKADEIIGKHFSMFYPADDPGRPDRALEIALRDGRFEEEGWRFRRDGTRFLANVTITPVFGATGELAGYAKVTRDLTERKAELERSLAAARRAAAEEAARAAAEAKADELRALADKLGAQTDELERQRRVAELANKAKGEFLAAMSHELRTPLNAIGGYAQLMEMGIGGPITTEQRANLERIQRSQQHLLGIINDILNFSRIEAGQLRYDIGPVALGDVLDSGAAMIGPQAQVKGIDLDLAKCPVDIVASADRFKVEQILLNLLSNAVKFTPENGRIELSCDQVDGVVSISVRDSGIGIPADQLETIFAPFMQVGRSLASPKDGTGLGLAISRDLARAMDGDITVESREHHGSTFTLTLPRAK